MHEAFFVFSLRGLNAKLSPLVFSTRNFFYLWQISCTISVVFYKHLILFLCSIAACFSTNKRFII